MGVELFHGNRQTDGQTEMKKLIASFCNFDEAPKNRIAVRDFRFLPL
jgi:hypothetical protein